MVRFVVTDETVALAFQTLRDQVGEAATARADRERREGIMKAEKARAFLEATGTIAEREAIALQSDAVVAAQEGYYEAVRQDEECRNFQSMATLTIEAWRTTAANRRAMERAG